MVVGRKQLGDHMRKPSQAAPHLKGCDLLWVGFGMLPVPLKYSLLPSLSTKESKAKGF